MPSTTTRPRTPRVVAAAAAAAAGLALSGCGLLTSLAGEGEVFQLEVGDCLADEMTGEEISEAATVGCDQEHYGEVYGSIVMDDGEYPGDGTVTSQAEEDCTEEFESFVGMGYNESELDINMLYPTEETWDSLDDREIVCIIFDPAGQTTGSLSGAAR